MLALSNLTIFLLILHFLGDYPLQSETMAQEKSSLKGLLSHGLVHLLLSLFAWILLALQKKALEGLYLLIPLLLLHLALDFLKAKKEKWIHKIPLPLQDWHLYLMDQGLHLLMIYLLSEVLFDFSSFLFLPLGLGELPLKWILLLVLITKPANISFKVCFEKYQLISSAKSLEEKIREDVPEPGAGAMIGNLERILSAIFLSQGQYAAIGLIYTAKSIARYKQIEENKRFAEYYLIGTLYSILYVLVVYFVLIGPTSFELLKNLFR